jgi:hypothetical protein
MNTRKFSPVLSLILFIILAPSAFALTIDTRFIGGAAPRNSSGGGNLNDIMNTAAHMWESVYSDQFTLTLYYGWGHSCTPAAIHTLISQGNEPNRELLGTIIFNNSGSTPFYLDPTPGSNDEYRGRVNEYKELGGGSIIAARLLNNPKREVAGYVDLLSIALHEIGHALGMSTANRSFLEQCDKALLTISGTIPFAGTEIPLAFNNAGVTAHFDAEELPYGSLMSGINGDERRLPSELDIVAMAQLSGFTISSLTPTQTPTINPPSTIRIRPLIGLKKPIPSASNNQIIRKIAGSAQDLWKRILKK